MDSYRNRAATERSAGPRGARPSAADTADLSQTTRRAGKTIRNNAPASRMKRGAGAGANKKEGGRSARAGRSGTSARRRSALMRYAADNRVVQAIYALTTGPWRLAFYAAIAAVVLVSLYFPVRDLYTAYRTGQILEAQLAIRSEYNDQLQGEVDKLLSTEGIEETARSELGLVMPGEHAVEVIGADEEDSSTDSQDEDASGSASDDSDAGDGAANDATGTSAEDDGSVSTGSSEPSTSAEVEQAEQSVVNDVPWYIEVLDAVFFYQGVEGQTVSSLGD